MGVGTNSIWVSARIITLPIKDIKSCGHMFTGVPDVHNSYASNSNIHHD